MKFALVLAAVLVTASAELHPHMVQQEWDIFKSKHVKVYESIEEEAKRTAIFHQNLVEIEEHNKLYEQGLSTFKMGVTPFADMTSEEFMAYVNKSAVTGHPQVRGEKIVLSDDSPPDSVDWRSKNVLTPVKDQGNCGSCYSFSAIGALESAYAIAHGELFSLSEQQVVDCSKEYGNIGCSGGWPDNAFKYVADNYIASEKDYPYKQIVGNCHKAATSPVKVVGIHDLPPSVESVRSGIAKQPSSVIVHATDAWRLYLGGVLKDITCDPRITNHAVVAVGYDSQTWILRNSWGSNWGEGGYIRLSAAIDCGVEDRASFPQVA